MAQQTMPETNGLPRPFKYHGQAGELTMVQPLKPGGAQKVREQLSSADMATPGLVGTLHDIRIAFFDNDTRMLFVTTYDGTWDQYIDDFAAGSTLGTKKGLDQLWENCEGYPGLQSPNVKDWLVKQQTDVAYWWVAYPEATVKQIRKGQRVLHAWNELLDTAG